MKDNTVINKLKTSAISIQIETFKVDDFKGIQNAQTL